MKKQFDLNYYLAHPETKVVTRGGLRVRIICTDAKSHVEKRHVVALLCFEDGKRETSYRYYDNGMSLKGVETSYDLFFDIPDPAKKKVALNYDDLVERVKAGKTMWLVTDGDTVFNIVDFDFVSVYYIHGKVEKINFMSYNCLLTDDLMFADGDPCWKEVEE